MRPVHLSILITVPLLLTACPDHAHLPPTPSPTGEVDLDRSASVAGLDANSNGVRDDVDRVIAQYPLSDVQKQRVSAFAGAVQSLLTTPMTRDSAYERGADLQRTLACASQAVSDHTGVTDEVFDFTVNTAERVEAYLKFEQSVGGAVLNDVPSCDAPVSSAASLRGQAAAVPSDACASSGYVIAFFNGVQNTFMDAGNVIIALYDLYGRTYGPNNELLLYRRFYNPTAGLLGDLAESFRQKERETPEIRGQWELIWQALRGRTSDRILPGSPQDLALQFLRQTVADAAKRYTEQVIRQAPDQALVHSMVTQMNALILERRKILAVAHSQGNLFLNAVYDRVKPSLTTESLKTVHVAPASATVRGPYVLNSKDLIIGAIGSSLGFTQGPNVDVPFRPLEDPTGHFMLETYLNASLPAYPLVKGYMDDQLKVLQAPASGASAGFFTVTLTWDGPGDVDLHVTEPDGSHVYYGNGVGSVGYLDVDNTAANGPEHYYATCDTAKLQPGIYAVGLNNYARASGRTATVLLGTQNRSYDPVRLDVGPERGGGGDTSLLPVFKVQVTKDAQGNFSASQVR